MSCFRVYFDLCHFPNSNPYDTGVLYSLSLHLKGMQKQALKLQMPGKGSAPYVRIDMKRTALWSDTPK